MADKVRVGLIGIGGMGKMHYNCYQNNDKAQIVAICDVDEKKLQGDWSSIGLNIETEGGDTVDLTGVKTYSNYEELINDADVDLVDICLPTPLHSPVTVAALQAGKEVLCEKPMAFDVDGCLAMQQALSASGKQLLIGHCLRYWPEYVKAKELIDSGEYGQVLYARFYRAGGTPWWSYNNWLATGSQSGGAVLDMHIHDVDTALWWFGEPDNIFADGLIINDMPSQVDAIWRYDNGPVVHLHGSWDNNGGGFGYGFKVVLEKATIEHDSALGTFKLIQGGKEGDNSQDLSVANDLAYQKEIDDFVDCVASGRKLDRVTPEASRLAVEVAREELNQIQAKHALAGSKA